MKTIKTLWKSTPKIHFIIYFLFVFVVAGCNKDDAPPTTPVAVIESTPIEEVKLSDAKEITSFVFLLTNNPIEVNIVADIDEGNKTITAAMPPGTNITGLLPEVKISALSTIDHDTAQNFTESLEYTVTAEDGTTSVYTITITALLTQRQILQAILDANPGNTLGWDVQNTADLSALDGVATNVDGRIIELVMKENELTQLPPEIGQLTSLTEFRLTNNQLTSLPPEIGQLINLYFLDFGFNQLTSLPSEIVLLTDLSILLLDGNKLTTVPPEIVQLTNLETLVLSANELTILPPEMGQLTNLKALSLSGNEFTSLPIEIGQLSSLETLLLSGNELSDLPREIGQLTALVLLRLDFNQLSTVPSEFGLLSNLKALNLTRNPITSIPQEVCALRQPNGILSIVTDPGEGCDSQ